MTIRYLEDFQVGQRYTSGPHVVTADEIKRFAADFDPQPFHLEEKAAAEHSLFRGLAASGWHTAALTMRMMVLGDIKPAGGLIGAGVEEMRWPLPVRPGDTLRTESEVIEVRESRSRPKEGFIKVRTNTLNQNDQIVQTFVANMLVQKRPQ